MTQSRPFEIRALTIGIAGPLGMIGLAYVLWWVSNRLLYIGPLDRAAFGWLVVMPVWWLSPAVAALLWRGLPPGRAMLAATTIGAVLAAATATLAWTSIASELGGCQFGPRTPVGELVVPMAILGLAVGAGWAASALVASSIVRSGGLWRGLGAGVGLLVASTFAVIVGAALVLMLFTGCNRPT
jgi:hypothetical protein